MRRSFALLVFPLALVALVPALLLGRGGGESFGPAWGIDSQRLALMQQRGAELGLRRSSVFVAEAGIGPVAQAPVLLEGTTAGGRACAFVVRGSAAGPLECLDVVLRRRPLWAITYRPVGMPGFAVLAILRGDVQRLAIVEPDGRLTGSVILEPGHVFNGGAPGSSLRLRLYGRRGRVIADVRLHA